MEIIKVEQIVTGTDRVKLKVVSELNVWEDTITLYKQHQNHRLATIEAYQIRTYLKRYVKSRIKAYTETMGKNSDRVISLTNLAHYLETYYPTGGAQGFFKWIYSRKDLLQDTMPATENIATLKIRVILDKCRDDLGL